MWKFFLYFSIHNLQSLKTKIKMCMKSYSPSFKQISFLYFQIIIYFNNYKIELLHWKKNYGNSKENCTHSKEEIVVIGFWSVQSSQLDQLVSVNFVACQVCGNRIFTAKEIYFHFEIKRIVSLNVGTGYRSNSMNIDILDSEVCWLWNSSLYSY